MTIDTTYMNLAAMNSGSNISGNPYDNLTNGNPLMVNMLNNAKILGEQYRQMNAYIQNLKAQTAKTPVFTAPNAQSYNNTYMAPLFSSSTSSSGTNSNTNYNNRIRTNYSSLSIAENGSSELKPGLFKGALAGKEALVTRLCRKYGVSPALVAAIIGLESGWGTSNLAMHNNFGGLRKTGDAGSNGNGFGYFSSVEKGLEEMIKNLAKYPQRYGDVSAVNFNNLDSIGRHYCDVNWASKVRETHNTRVKNYLA